MGLVVVGLVSEWWDVDGGKRLGSGWVGGWWMGIGLWVGGKMSGWKNE